MIEIKNVTKKYGDNTAIKDVSFNVNDGEIFAFIGHNGAGKTTLIKAIVGIHKFDEGDILINGKSIKDDPIACKKIMSFVPDNPELYEQMKAIDFINFICDIYEVPQETREKNIKKYAKMFEIEDNLNDTIESFSHGMKQKIALISALAHNPKVLIMDEPFVGLDPKATFTLKEIMHKMCEEGMAVFFSTHIISDIEKCADDIVYISKGKIVAAISKTGFMEEFSESGESLEDTMLRMEGGEIHA